MTEDEHTKAIHLMADAMMEGAKFYGPCIDTIGGDRHIMAERALNALMTRFSVTAAGDYSGKNIEELRGRVERPRQRWWRSMRNQQSQPPEQR